MEKLTLHEAMEIVIKENGSPMTCSDIADALNNNKLYVKKDGSKISSSQIHARIHKYPTWFALHGDKVFLLHKNIFNHLRFIVYRLYKLLKKTL